MTRESSRIIEILSQAKKLAKEYRALTGKPLGITGEVAEYEAARLLGLELTPPRTAGHDAIRQGDGRRFQIKGRCVLSGSSRSQRVGKIDIKKHFDAVLLVLLDENLDAVEIYEAKRAPVIAALIAPGSKARNDRGALDVSKFKRIGRCVWRRNESGVRAAIRATDLSLRTTRQILARKSHALVQQSRGAVRRQRAPRG